jgi:hypothetical protein
VGLGIQPDVYDRLPLHRSNFIRREWRPLLNAAKLPTVGFNTLRHTMATDSLRIGLHGKGWCRLDSDTHECPQ